MLRTALSIGMLLCGLTPSGAETSSPARHVRLPLQSAEGVAPKTQAFHDARAMHHAHAKAAAHRDAFERRLALRARRAMTSICDGCAASARQPRNRPHRMEANAAPSEPRIDDPAQAPRD